MRLRTPAGRQDRSLKEEDAPVFKHLFGELATCVHHVNLYYQYSICCTAHAKVLCVLLLLHYRETLSYEDFLAFRRNLKQEIMRIQISFSPLVLLCAFTLTYLNNL